MAVTLASLVARLQGLVSVKDNVPSAAQYQQAVEDAVADYSKRSLMRKLKTLSIVAGTAAYSMPSDFLFVVKVATLQNPTGVVVGNYGIVPLSADYDEQWFVTARTLTFYPTPTYALSRDVWYAAGHVLDVNSAYPDMVEEETGIVLLKAQAMVIYIRANKEMENAWRYAVGSESVSKENLAKAMREQAQNFETEYLAAVKARIGVVGLTSDYDSTGH